MNQLEINSFKCQNMFVINPEVKVYVENICLHKTNIDCTNKIAILIMTKIVFAHD